MNYLQGIVKNITFYNEENHYGILKIHVTASDIKRGLFEDTVDNIMTVTGYFPKPSKNEEYRFYGEITYHQTYGEQFSASTYEKSIEINIEGLIDYLSSDLFPGIGPVTAEKVVSVLGPTTITKIIEDRSCLENIAKLTDKQKDTLYQSLIEHKASEQTLIRLYGYGITSKIAMRIIHIWRENTIRYLEENPYQLIDDVEGIGFERADLIARKLGFEENHPLRIKALMIHLFKSMSIQQGHTYLPLQTFTETALYRLNKDSEMISEEDFNGMMSTLIKQGAFALDEERLTLRSVLKAEQEIIIKLKELNDAPQKLDLEKVNRLIENFENLESISYTKKQKQAIIESLKHRMMIITGGPGTGKTTVIKGLIHVYYRYHDLAEPSEDEASFIHMIAPTGRAAKRMKESTKYYATTIHRFLGYGFDGSFQHDKYHPVEGHLFIVDEASMIDLYLASQLLQSLPNYANVVFVGDDAQLPSVGPGQVFKDLIESDTIPIVRLDVIHRQAEHSKIIDLAENIREGKLPQDLQVHYEDRYVFKESPANFQSRLTNIINFFLSKGYDFIEDIQILIPLYKGPLGIDETNRFLQETYNQNNQKLREHGHRVFKINDKVLQLTNQIEDGIMNGDQGRVIDIDAEGNVSVEFLENVVTYKTKDLINLTHAYAMSVHKSQGSEYKIVILPIFNSYSIMLRRKLIYTAITRAKERLVIFGHIDKLGYAVRVLEEERLTHLKTRLLNF